MSTDDNNKKDGGKKALSGKFLFKKTTKAEQDLDWQASQQTDMTYEELGRALLDAAFSGNPDTITELITKGVDINFECPSSKARALHLAASNNAIFAIDVLMKDSNLDYLVKDRHGRLPSALAIEVADNHELGERLMQAETKQASERGLDYRTLLTGVTPGGDDPSP